MLCRRIYSIQDQWSGASVDKLVLSSCRDYDQVSCLDILVLASDRCFTGARSESQSLIDGVFLVTQSARPGESVESNSCVIPRHQFHHPLGPSSVPAESTSLSTAPDEILPTPRGETWSCSESRPSLFWEDLRRGFGMTWWLRILLHALMDTKLEEYDCLIECSLIVADWN